MEEQELISKKELLQLTQISYGQLYRWKRENLIPESWFIKKSSFTGQETFFPKDKMLKRIKEIVDLKGQYSLEELADMISPELNKRVYYTKDLTGILMFSETLVSLCEREMGKNNFNFYELLFIRIIEKLQSDSSFKEETLSEIIASIGGWTSVMKDTAYRFVICSKDAMHYFLLAKQDSRIYYDKKTREILVFDLDEISKEINMNLKEILKGE